MVAHNDEDIFIMTRTLLRSERMLVDEGEAWDF